MSEYRGRFTGDDTKDVLNVEKLKQDVTRDKHEQVIIAQPPPSQEFLETQFVCYVQDIHYDRRGDVVITMKVPYRYRMFANPLLDAYGIPLSADFQRWAPFDEHRRQAANDA